MRQCLLPSIPLCKDSSQGYLRPEEIIMNLFRMPIIFIMAIVYTSVKLLLLLLFCLLCLYLLPFIIIIRRTHTHAQAIFWLNLTLGWTVFAWFALFSFAWWESPGTHAVTVGNDVNYALLNNEQDYSE